MKTGVNMKNTDVKNGRAVKLSDKQISAICNFQDGTQMLIISSPRGDVILNQRDIVEMLRMIAMNEEDKQAAMLEAVKEYERRRARFTVIGGGKA